VIPLIFILLLVEIADQHNVVLPSAASDRQVLSFEIRQPAKPRAVGGALMTRVPIDRE